MFELVSEQNAFDLRMRLAARKGFSWGITSGAAACAMHCIANRNENGGKHIIGAFTGTGRRYLRANGLFEA